MFRFLLLLTLFAVTTAEKFEPVADLSQKLVDTIFSKRLTVTNKLEKINQLAKNYDFGAARDEYYLQVFLFDPAGKFIGEQKEEKLAKPVKDSMIAEFLFKKKDIFAEELAKRMVFAVSKSSEAQKTAVQTVLANTYAKAEEIQKATEKAPV